MTISHFHLQKQRYRVIEQELAIKRVLLNLNLIDADTFSADSTNKAIKHMLNTSEITANTSTDDEIAVAFMELSAFYGGLDSNG